MSHPLSGGVVLALGGGGAKCYAQIGVLRVLERHGIPVRGLACTSAGGLVGAAYAAGHALDELEQVFVAFQRNGGPSPHLWGRAPSLYRVEGAMALMDELLGGRRFEDLALPLALTCIDAATAEAVPLHEGDVVDALRAAVAIPGLFPPHRVAAAGQRELLDGGVIDPIPVALARTLAPGVPVMAVVLQPPTADWREHPASRRLERLPLLRHLAGWRVLRALGVHVRAAEWTHRTLTEARLHIDRPEIVVRPEVMHVDLFDHDAALDLVARGERAAEAVVGAMAGVTGVGLAVA